MLLLVPPPPSPQFLPTMQENYQRMDTRYGCVPEHPCDGVMGVTREADAMVWVRAVHVLVMCRAVPVLFLCWCCPARPSGPSKPPSRG